MTGGSGKVVKGLAVGTEVQVGRSGRGDAGTEVFSFHSSKVRLK
jgi:hypothetical protein